MNAEEEEEEGVVVHPYPCSCSQRASNVMAFERASNAMAPSGKDGGGEDVEAEEEERALNDWRALNVWGLEGVKCPVM